MIAGGRLLLCIILIFSVLSGVYSFRLHNKIMSLSKNMLMASKDLSSMRKVSKSEWKSLSAQFKSEFQRTLYSKEMLSEPSRHKIRYHPVYNFIHTYYDFSFKDLSQFSPGVNCLLEDVTEDDITIGLLHPSFLNSSGSDPSAGNCSSTSFYSVKTFQNYLNDHNGRYRHASMFFNYEILKNTMKKAPFFGCFGYHEWAMLYSGRKDPSLRKAHQQLELRVPQETIDNLVETQGLLKCTHYDAIRFFQYETKEWNQLHPFHRRQQPVHEQPGCIHANMDLFRYAYQLYPLISSDLLLKALQIALLARTIDIRASPYDATGFEGCEKPIKVETTEGKKEYFIEQESLYQKAKIVRNELFLYYECILSDLLQDESNRMKGFPVDNSVGDR
jgi:hypothetical protein